MHNFFDYFPKKASLTQKLFFIILFSPPLLVYLIHSTSPVNIFSAMTWQENCKGYGHIKQNLGTCRALAPVCCQSWYFQLEKDLICCDLSCVNHLVLLYHHPLGSCSTFNLFQAGSHYCGVQCHHCFHHQQWWFLWQWHDKPHNNNHGWSLVTSPHSHCQPM